MLISYIIPVYNGEIYLKKCLDSLLNQDYGDALFEIICIDDCSKDKSKEIIKAYKNTNPNVILIENTINLKTGTVCNIGLERAKGDFVWIIGQDDWIQHNSVSILSDIISKDPEVIAFNYRRVDFSENELHSAEVFDNSSFLKGADYIRSKFGSAFPYYLLGYEWRAIFNREYLKKQNIRFPDGGIYEDTTFLFKAIMYSNKFTSIADFLYYYRVNPNSITDLNKKHKGNLVFEFSFKVGNEVLDLANEIKLSYPDFSEQLLKMTKWYFNGFAHKVIGASLREKINFYAALKANQILVKSSKHFLNPLSLLLTDRLVGILIATILKPAYLFKKMVIDKNKNKQKWSY